MGNIALNKAATASGTVAPFTPAKAVDGITTPLNRWLCVSAPPPEGNVPPSWLRVDLGEPYWVNRWVVSQQGAMGWAATNNMVDYRFQGSLDDANWFDLDSVTNNSANQTDRTFMGKQARYVRIYITKGLRSNPPCNSIGDLQVYEAANAPYLTNLVPVNWTLSPGFNPKVFAYTVNVASGTGTIQFTPTAAAGMAIKVNGTVVASGQTSAPITLSLGNNPVTVTVTSNDNTMTTTYNINVFKPASVQIATLSGLILYNSRDQGINFTPPFNAGTHSYAVDVANAISSVKVAPSTSVVGASITVNGIAVPNGNKSSPIAMGVGDNTITIDVSCSGYTTGSYTITVTRAAS